MMNMYMDNLMNVLINSAMEWLLYSMLQSSSGSRTGVLSVPDKCLHVWREIFRKIYYSDLQCHENTIGKGFGEMQYVIHVQYVVDNLTRILSTGRVLKVISVNSYSVG